MSAEWRNYNIGIVTLRRKRNNSSLTFQKRSIYKFKFKKYKINMNACLMI